MKSALEEKKEGKEKIFIEGCVRTFAIAVMHSLCQENTEPSERISGGSYFTLRKKKTEVKNVKKRSLSYIIVSVCLMVALFCGGTVESYAASRRVKVSGKACYSEAYKALNYVNKERAKRGLSKLEMDKDLQKAALQRAAEIVVFNGHIRPDGRPWYTVSRKAKGENYGYGGARANDMVEGWMHSKSHKKNILNKRWKSTGIACVKVYGEYYWVQLFSNCTSKRAKKLRDKRVKLTVRLY